MNAAKAVSLILLGVMLSGCLGTDELDAEERVEPYTRISGWSGGEGGGQSCFLFSSLPELRSCMEVAFSFTDFRCDPPQLLFALLEGRAASQQAFVEALGTENAPTPEASPAGAFVYCEYAVAWSITARSLPPDSRLHVTVSHDGQEKTGTCEIDLNSECSTEGRIDGRFTFHGPDETVELLADLHADIETVVPRERPVGGPGGEASRDLRLSLHT